METIINHSNICGAGQNQFNIASLNSRAKYIVEFDGLKSKKEKAQDFFNKDQIIVPVISHGEQKMVDIKDRLYEINIKDSSIEIVCGVGNESVRIDEVVKLLLTFLSLPKDEWNITKKTLYLTSEDGEVLEVDEALEKLKIKD